MQALFSIPCYIPKVYTSTWHMIGFNKSLNETNGQNDSTDTQGDKKEPKAAAVAGYGFVVVGGL